MSRLLAILTTLATLLSMAVDTRAGELIEFEGHLTFNIAQSHSPPPKIRILTDEGRILRISIIQQGYLSTTIEELHLDHLTITRYRLTTQSYSITRTLTDLHLHDMPVALAKIAQQDRTHLLIRHFLMKGGYHPVNPRHQQAALARLDSIRSSLAAARQPTASKRSPPPNNELPDR